MDFDYIYSLQLSPVSWDPSNQPISQLHVLFLNYSINNFLNPINANHVYLDVYWGIGNLTAVISSKKSELSFLKRNTQFVEKEDKIINLQILL